MTPSSSSKLTTDADFTLTASASSGLTSFSWSSSNTSVVTVSGTGATGTVHIVGAGSATITATQAGGVSGNYNYAQASGTASISVKSATPAPVITLGGSGGSGVTSTTPAPTATISASPTSGVAPLSTTITWTAGNAGSFAVAKNGSTWATTGSSQADTLSTAGTYTYTLTVQPLAYAATLGWSATNATSYRVTGPGGYDSGSITATSVTVMTPGAYTVTATGPGGTAQASITAPPAPSAVSASTAVTTGPAVALMLQITPLSGPPPLNIQVTWSTSNATSVSMTGQGVNSSASSGSQAVTLQAGNYTYTLSAANPYSHDSQALNVTASRGLVTLTLSTNDAALGSVTGSGVYLVGDTASPVATPASGAYFTGWTGDITGTNPTPSVAMTTSMAAVANFAAKTKDVVTLANPGNQQVRVGEPRTVTVSANSLSGAPVALSVVSGPASLTGNTLTLNGNLGTVTLSAIQPNELATYMPSDPVQVQFNVTAMPPPVTRTVSGGGKTTTVSKTVKQGAYNDAPTH